MVSLPQKIGIIGAGRMGVGIAQLFLEHGFSVLLHDTAPALLQRAKQKLKERLWREDAPLGDRSPEEILKNLTLAESLSAFHLCDFVVEAIFESYEAKEALLARCHTSLSPNTLLVTNTSSLSVTRLAQKAPNPHRFLGLHFMNPASRLPLVELIRTPETEDDAVQICQELALFLGKTVIFSHDAPAFVLNRLLIPMINEAILALEERIATAEDIDTALTAGAQHPMGPLSLADFIGLDVVLAILKTLQGERGEKYRPSTLLEDLVRRGHLGRKSGKGFFSYL
jgi:3-hydroxybutyryl-CoA dehydrogenase